MTETKTRNPLSQLSSFSEDLLGKASKNPAATKFLQGANQLRDRVDELSKRVRGLDALEQQVADLEKRVAKLEKPARKPAPPKPPKHEETPGEKPA
jgi:polyhydroxyalkanoate synthesis regulator phasin